MQEAEEDIFGQEYHWFERTGGRLSLHTFDYVIPSQRTLAQKFQMETMKALSSLKEMNWITTEEEYEYLSSSFYKTVSEQEHTYNAGAFALLVYIINRYHPSITFDSNRVRELWTRIQTPSSVSSVSSWEDYIHRYGITVEDLIRYLHYMEQFQQASI